MTNAIIAKIVNISELDEQDVTLSVNENILMCFVNSCSHALEAGESYSVELTMNLLDEYQVCEAHRSNVLIEKIPSGYSYYLYGYLEDSVFKTFADLDDEDIHYDHPELNDHFIKVRVDRIDVNFL